MKTIQLKHDLQILKEEEISVFLCTTAIAYRKTQYKIHFKQGKQHPSILQTNSALELFSCCNRNNAKS